MTKERVEISKLNADLTQSEIVDILKDLGFDVQKTPESQQTSEEESIVVTTCC
ncbi:hypothetical protein [Bacillus cereus]|uniref:Uncharacterized protein n=1 Tax=Bacillus cereus TaxID=1396 RepID=A0A162PD40_BACCE|nr:hypothetical protein [Bacillus cereus]KZD71192.1 hypothetical protein B4088_0922 [Bacillus cereus]HDR8321337.1 hypothetical protein [Bacillus cereus]HDR8330989.1 hypothetical protein [Bacillus cereus]HDR8336343.1 hypothetical protein [Bacillus cereus]